MSIIFAIFINSIIIIGVFNLIGFEFYPKLFDDIDLIPLFLGIIYLAASHMMGGLVRASCGLSLIIMSAIDLGFSEPENSLFQAIIALIGVLTPL